MTRRALVGLALAGALVATLAFAQEPSGPGRKMPDRGQQHVQQGMPIPYEDNPPTSGPHWPVVARWGMYQEEVPAEVFVHNLEHGGIVVLYHCATPCPDVVRELEDTVQALPRSKFGHVKVVVSPYSKLKSRFALLAWTRLDTFDRFDRERIARFVRAWQDKGPEDVP